MSKIYITKSELKKTIEELLGDNTEYPQPVLFLLSSILLIILIVMAFIAVVVVGIIGLAYILLFWVDILVGKYIIKRILKL
jgi:hypothetical protein